MLTCWGVSDFFESTLLEFSLFKFLFCMFKTLFVARIELLSFQLPIIVCSTTEIGKARRKDIVVLLCYSDWN